MMLRSIDFIQSENKSLEWRLEGLKLNKINLIVGRNACGKTKTLSAIAQLAKLVSNAVKLRGQTSSSSYRIMLADEPSGEVTTYALKISDSQVVEEMLTIAGVQRISRREGGIGTMWFDRQRQDLEFQAPPDQLACASRRDSIQHPYIDTIYNWGRSSLQYRFNSSDLGKNHLISITEKRDAELDTFTNPAPTDWPVHFVFKMGLDVYADNFKAAVLEDMRKLQYPLRDIGLRVYERMSPKFKEKHGHDLLCLYIEEEGLTEPITQFEMSDGMFRALSILIQVNQAAMDGAPACVIIDDIGEGLDYERSCQLIKLLIEKAGMAGIQLIMATNDRFIMNSVPLEHWTVLVRERAERGTRIKVYNYETHKKNFDEFAYTGLNNFDFFADGFFEEGLGGPE